MKKIISVLLTLFCLINPLLSLADGPVRIAALKGPTAMGMVEMMKNDPDDYVFTLTGAVDEIAPMLLKQDVDMAALPANLAANLYQKTNGEILALCVNTLGVLYIVENGDSIRGLEDLRGRTLYASGKGATPEYALRYLLEGYGLDPDRDVTIEFKSEHSECLAGLMAQPGSAALLPQPFVTAARQKQASVRVAVDLNRAWEELGNGQLITGVLAVRKAFALEHPEEVNKIMLRYAQSVRYVNENPADAAELIEEYGILSAEVAREAIPDCRIVCLEGDEMKNSLSAYLQVLYEQNPAAIGGAMPDDDFYFQQ